MDTLEVLVCVVLFVLIHFSEQILVFGLKIFSRIRKVNLQQLVQKEPAIAAILRIKNIFKASLNGDRMENECNDSQMQKI